MQQIAGDVPWAAGSGALWGSGVLAAVAVDGAVAKSDTVAEYREFLVRVGAESCCLPVAVWVPVWAKGNVRDWLLSGQGGCLVA